MFINHSVIGNIFIITIVFSCIATLLCLRAKKYVGFLIFGIYTPMLLCISTFLAEHHYHLSEVMESTKQVQCGYVLKATLDEICWYDERTEKVMSIKLPDELGTTQINPNYGIYHNVVTCIETGCYEIHDCGFIKIKCNGTMHDMKGTCFYIDKSMYASIMQEYETEKFLKEDGTDIAGLFFEPEIYRCMKIGNHYMYASH